MLSLSTSPGGQSGWGGPTAPCGISPSLPLRTRVLALSRNRQGETKAAPAREFTETGLLCQVRGRGFSMTALQNAVLLLGDLLWFESPHAPDKRLDVPTMGAAADTDRQTVFPLGLAPVRFLPSHAVWVSPPVPRKSNFENKTQILRSSRTPNHSWKPI